jgi:predicted SnoaL-like aldol condensation-catalyzing enzyme
MHRWLAGVVLAAACGPAWAAPPPLISDGAPRTRAQENADQQIALAFRGAACGTVAARHAAAGFLAPDFRNHNVEAPSGAAAYGSYLLRPAAGGGSEPAAGAMAAGPLFAVSDGDLTMLATGGAGGDPGARFAANLFEVQNGRITQMWYSGPTADPAAPVADDSRSCSPANAPPLVPNGPATREQQGANKQLVIQFIEDFFVNGDTTVAARVLAPDLKSHVPGVPSGRDFAAVAHKHEDRVVAPDPAQALFALADGELVAIGFPVPYASDPGAWFAVAVVRVAGGRITEWWYSGYPAGHPRGAWRGAARE